MTQQIQIQSWESLQQAPWETLILGNGASLALHSGFSYSSLHQVATTAGLLPTAAPIFSALNSADFEHVLLACWHANVVNSAMGSPSGQIANAYVEVRNALVGAVRSTHAVPGGLTTQLSNIGAFASKFPTVVTFNYDLTLYWAMLEFNSNQGRWFKDGFLWGGFDPAWSRLRAPYGAPSTTMVFFAHGSLMLARDLLGQEVKIAAQNASPGWSTALLNQIIANWTAGTHLPLFVSEGTSTQKLQAIRRSPYLTAVYDQVLSSPGNALVVYGLSFAANDDHFLEALKRSPPKLMAISVYCGSPSNVQQAFCHSVTAKLKTHLPWTQVAFFDSASPGCWCF